MSPPVPVVRTFSVAAERVGRGIWNGSPCGCGPPGAVRNARCGEKTAARGCRTTGCGADRWVWCGPVGVVRTGGCGADRWVWCGPVGVEAGAGYGTWGAGCGVDDGCGALGAGTGHRALVRCGCGPPGVGGGAGVRRGCRAWSGPLGVWSGLLGVEWTAGCGVGPWVWSGWLRAVRVVGCGVVRWVAHSVRSPCRDSRGGVRVRRSFAGVGFDVAEAGGRLIGQGRCRSVSVKTALRFQVSSALVVRWRRRIGAHASARGVIWAPNTVGAVDAGRTARLREPPSVSVRWPDIRPPRRSSGDAAMGAVVSIPLRGQKLWHPWGARAAGIRTGGPRPGATKTAHITKTAHHGAACHGAAHHGAAHHGAACHEDDARRKLRTMRTRRSGWEIGCVGHSEDRVARGPCATKTVRHEDRAPRDSAARRFRAAKTAPRIVRHGIARHGGHAPPRPLHADSAAPGIARRRG